MSLLSQQQQARLSGRSLAGLRGARPRRRTAGPRRPPARPRDAGGLRPQPILLGLRGQNREGFGDDSAHVSLRSGPLRAGPCQSGPTPARRSSQVQPNPGHGSPLPCRSLRGPAPLSVLPSAGSRRPRPRPDPPRLGPALPAAGPVLRKDGGPVTNWCRRGSEHGARREAAPSVAENGPLTCQPPAPPDRPPAGSSPQPRCPATAQNTRGRPRRETAGRGGTAGPGTAKKSGRGLGSGSD